MATRKSNRLAAKERLRHEGRGAENEGDDRVNGRRASVGGALGLTPAVPKGRNLVIAKAAGAAEAAADRLDELNASESETRRRSKRRSSKARKAARKKQAAAAIGARTPSAYHAKSRESMALLRNTEQLFASDEERKIAEGMPEAPNAPQKEADDFENEASPEQEAEGEVDDSVIRTPGTPAKPTASDEEFIAPEGTPDADPDYELTEDCLLYTSPSPRDRQKSRMPSSA